VGLHYRIIILHCLHLYFLSLSFEKISATILSYLNWK